MDFFDFKIKYILKKQLTTMKSIKTYGQFIDKTINESFTITLEQLPKIGDIVDKVDYKEGEKIAFIDFKGVKNIPVHVIDNNKEVEKV